MCKDTNLLIIKLCLLEHFFVCLQSFHNYFVFLQSNKQIINIMVRLLRCICIVLLTCCVGVIRAQYVKVHRVQKKETVYGIARMYGITQEQLRQAIRQYTQRFLTGSTLPYPFLSTDNTIRPG